MRNFDIVVFIIKSPDVAYSEAAVLTIRTKGNRDKLVNVPVVKL